MPNIKFDDDFMFPVSTQGMKKAGMILESAEPSDTDQDQVTDLPAQGRPPQGGGLAQHAGEPGGLLL